jgi:hypothetical protein
VSSSSARLHGAEKRSGRGRDGIEWAYTHSHSRKTSSRGGVQAHSVKTAAFISRPYLQYPYYQVADSQGKAYSSADRFLLLR